jgi:hypothetical protein
MSGRTRRVAILPPMNIGMKTRPSAARKHEYGLESGEKEANKLRGDTLA